MAVTASWEHVLRAPEPCDHFVQLYTDDATLARAVARFIGDGLAQAEAGVLIATPAHADGVARELGRGGVDVWGAVHRGQLTILDARESLAAGMVDGRPDRAAFRALVTPVLERVRRAGYAEIRLFGEMVDLLWEHNLEAALELERLWNEVLAEQRASLLCGYRIDNFDRHVHRSTLPRISRCHSHLIPVDDYDRLDRAVEQAYTDVFGPAGDARHLRDVMVARCPDAPAMPPAQAALFALRQVSPLIADAVLERTRRHYRA